MTRQRLTVERVQRRLRECSERRQRLKVDQPLYSLRKVLTKQ
ncbi:MAG: hypothetical protein ACK55Z_37190 [bacterium]